MNTDTILNQIGKTPLVELKNIVRKKNIRLFAKLEMFNPTYSIKDRIVLHIINDAEIKGLLKPNSTLVEATSGNTGASLAMIGSLKGYKVVITTPGKTSKEKVTAMRAYGADVNVCPISAREGDAEHYITLAKTICSNTPDSFMLNQYNNLENVRAHYLSTGPEIWDDMDGEIDYFVACSSSGGTITGAGRYLKEKKSTLKIIMPDPIGSSYYSYFKTGEVNPSELASYQVEGAGKDFICDCMDFSLIDDVIQFSDNNAFEMVKELALFEGILAGGTSGAALYAAKILIEKITGPANIVVILPDSGLKYMSSIYP